MWAIEQGFRAMKVKVGIDCEQDVARVRAVREAVGACIRLGIDANGAWDVEAAIEMIERLRDFDLWFVEQPVPPGDVSWLAEVRRRTGARLVADESVYTVNDANAIIRAEAADALSVYVGKSAGIDAARGIASRAASAGLQCTIGSNLEMGVGTAAMVHLALATPGITAETFPCDIIGPMFYSDELLIEPLPIRGGEARVQRGPGLGVELDWKKVEQYRVF
jgi:muconate cycloisomerase